MEKKWYIVHAYTGHEDKVKAYLEKLISSGEMKNKISSILIPTEEIVEIRKNKRRISKRKFFPGYVLIEMVIDNETYWGVRNIPGVTGFLGGVKPIPLQPEELENIVSLTQREAQAKPKPAVMFEKDETVRVIEGPFENFVGVVENVNEEKGKLRVMVTIFGRATPVELDFLQVEKI
ncbi:MAG: transcription termination/antitermination protein NusG [Elusimicrobiota bacterium]|nr:transcription termination/antitermination protein NusG [Elusimicrobiota bacterium]